MSSYGLSVGIVGLPNVGKSTLFNALLKKQQALAANYPFATIEPNVGVVPVPDERLETLARITAGEILKHPKSASYDIAAQVQDDKEKNQDDKSKWPPIKPATVEFLDIAGLVKGASEGAGLGNKFLSHIREVSIIAHVVRAFSDPSASSGQAPIIREGSIDPKSDYDTIETELILADLESISKRKSQKANPQLNPDRIGVKSQNELIEKLEKALNQGQPVRNLKFTEEEQEVVDQMFLLSAKPEIIVLNVSEEDYTEEKINSISKRYGEMLFSVTASEAKQSHEIASSYSPRNDIVVICAKIEAELSELSKEEQKQYLADLGLKESGLERLIKKAYETLGLISFLTAGEKEVRAWTIKKGSTAPSAAGVIHTDFIKNFIKAEVVSFNDFISNNGWKSSREKGKARMEGKDYIMKDGDVVEFKIGK
ncbi:redox-regulated ATPase YchF [Candidatus Microgenomates bacterium]|nr:MAG: redox-regulated ATPase YchF [Candidatus Microgenomates bacterium]